MLKLLNLKTNDKEFPNHHLLQNSKKVKEFVLCEHIRSIDYEIRNLKFAEKANDEDFENIINLLNACL